MASYTFFCQQCAVGVFFEYRDFINWIEETAEYKQVPNPIIPSLKYLVYAILAVGTFVVGSGYFAVEDCWSDKFVNEMSFPQKMLHTNFAWAFKRYFYYSAFLFETGVVIACGLGYNGRAEVTDKDVDPKNPDQKGEHLWDKFIGVHVWECETSDTVLTFIRGWNHRVHIFLKYYVAERLSGGERPKAWHLGAVFAIGAFWHGFYPFYYVAFFTAAMMQFMHKDVYQCWLLFQPIPKPIRKAAAFVITQFSINYCGI